MHQIIFYPVGNGDTSQIILENGKRFLFDFRHLKKTEDGEGPEINLKDRLKDELEKVKKKSFDVVAFSHSDADHIENSTEIFELRHADKYQGKDRIKIDELWVPAAMIIETASSEEQSSEFVIWRKEARHRLKEGKGIRVFSKPEKLKDWLEENDLTVDSRRHLITDAGNVTPGFTLASDGVEFFCHSPFIKHVDDGDVLRNEAALVFSIRFLAGTNTFDYLYVGDSKCEVLEEIVKITKSRKREDRLKWDLFNIPHHCSYKALNDEKGAKETIPKPLVKDLLLYGKESAYVLCSSNPIDDSKEAEEQKQPPHIQAQKCYQRYLKAVNGAKFLVTMEEPNKDKPEPIIFTIDSDGMVLKGPKLGPALTIITSSPAPRAG